MNTKQLQDIIISLGYSFKKTEPQNSDTPVWQCLDDDMIPVSQHRVLSNVIWDVERQLGGV